MRWDKLPKPWTKEQCRRRYVESEEPIGIRDLANACGYNKATVEVWVRQDLWVEQRKRYQEDLKKAVQQKTIEKTSDKISDELSQIVTENYQVHRLARNYVAKLIEARAKQLEEDLQLPVEERKKAVSKHNASEINQLTQALTKLTNAINEGRGIRYFIDMNAAADKLTREGYEIIDPKSVSNDE
jgi:hypothetical protein